MSLSQPKEAAIQMQIVHLLRIKGYFVWEMLKGSQGNGVVYCTKGIPDLFVFKPGFSAFLEVKRPGTGRLSPAQKERHHELTVCGLPVYVVTSVEDVLAVIGHG